MKKILVIYNSFTIFIRKIDSYSILFCCIMTTFSFINDEFLTKYCGIYFFLSYLDNLILT